MTSLCPGPLFHAPGLNQHSTPTPRNATPGEIDGKLSRLPFNGHDWPNASPVARVYDIGNTSTSLVLLNKRRKKKSQLRGLTERSGEITMPNPERHVPEEHTVNWYHHKKCIDSSSEPFKPRLQLDLGWVNTQQRPPVKFDSGSAVNHKRHTSCRVTADSPVVGWHGAPRRPTTGTSYGKDSELRTMTPILNDPDLSQGERKYLFSIARIYSTSQMKALKQDQYHQLLFKEFAKGYHAPKEYEKYLSYLNTPRKTQFGKLDNYEDMRRSASAPPPPSTTDSTGRGGEHETKQKKKSTACSSWAPSLISSHSYRSSLSGRQQNRKGGSKKKSTGKQTHKPLPPMQKPTKESEPQSVKSKSPEPVLAVACEEEDKTVHTRKEESEHPEDGTSTSAKESEAESQAKTASDEANAGSPQKTATESPRKGKSTEGTPRKEEDSPSPRKGEDQAESPRRSDTVDGQEGRGDSESVEQQSNANPPAPAASSSNATSNNFLALIVSDAEKEDDSEQDKRSAGETGATSTTAGQAEDTAAEERGSGEEGGEGTTAEQSGTGGEGGQEAAGQNLPRDFSDTHLASGYSPRIHKEGRERPLSRAGRPSEIKEKENRENSDDDYDDTDEETEKAKVGDNEESGQQSGVVLDQPATDTARTDRTDGTEERGGELEEPPTNKDDKRAGSPDDGRDERADDTHHDSENRQSVFIPVNTSQRTNNGAVLDLSAEGKNRDVDKIEY